MGNIEKLSDMVMQPIESWFPYLGWDRLPNFGYCHTIQEYDDFMCSFLETNDIKRLKKDFFLNLTGGHQAHNILLQGDPGCGKTTFLHYIMLEAEKGGGKDSFLDKYTFYRMPASRVASVNEKECENIILDHIAHAWEKVFNASGRERAFNRYQNQNITIKEKNNKWCNYYKDPQQKFPRILVFIVDDIDLLERNDQVMMVLNCINTHLKVPQVKKWCAIRPTTYLGYSKGTREIIDWMYPSQFEYNPPSLYAVLDKRIRNGHTNGQVKNPFSDDICSVTMDIRHRDMRKSLATIEAMLRYIPHGNFDTSVAEEVLIQYFNKHSISGFLRSSALPNLYRRAYRVGGFPITFDLLLSNTYTESYEILFASTARALEERAEVSKFFDSERTLNLRKDYFDQALDILIDEKLCEYNRKLVRQTKKGEVLAQYISRKLYREKCQEIRNYRENDKLFWSLITPYLNHWEIVYSFLSWDKPM